MGVKHLWTVLTPFCDRKPLYELQGKTVAVDLSCWICEAQNIAEYQVQPRMYLRNLYFRTCYLLLMDVSPVFVLEGKAPELKYDTITARNAVQFKGAKPKTDGVQTGKGRTRFHFVLRQCEEMLGYMGLACIKGNGEAESLCAYLNEDGLVEGCISQDSDCFAYGAQVVYRNFSISTQGAQAASGGAVDVYDIRKANESLSFGRNKIIAMALLIGCDYSEGVHGVGKDSVLKFFETVSNEEVLDKIRSWRKNNNMYENYERQLADKNICTSCGHSGKIQGHTKNGCASCNTTKGCDPFNYKTERLNMKNEVSMRNKAIKDPNFPNETLINEFLERKDNVKELDLEWKQPNVVKFIKFTTKFLQWEELYAFEKILPILTRWQCRNPELLKDENKLNGVLKPDRIKKVRNPKGVPSYEIIWSDPSECFKGLVPENQIKENNVDLEKLWSTIEPQNLVENAYPHLVEDFKQSKIKPKKISKRIKNKKDNVDGISDKLNNVSISEPKTKKAKKPKMAKGQKTIENPLKTGEEGLKTIVSRQKTTGNCLDDLDSSLKQLAIEKFKTKAPKPVETDVYDLDLSFKQMTIAKQKKATKTKVKTLDSFVKKAVTNSYKQKTSEICFSNEKNAEQNNSLQMIKDYSLHPISSTPAKAAESDLSFDLDISSFGDESDLELSDIVDDIVSRKDLKDNLKNIADQYLRGLEKSVEVVCLDTFDSNKDIVCIKNDSEKCMRFNTSDSNTEIENTIFEGFKSNKYDCDNDLLDNLEDPKSKMRDKGAVLEDGLLFELDNVQNDLDTDRRDNQNEVSSFFINNPADENDLFEKTFNDTFKNFRDTSDSDTEEYEYDINELNSDKENEGSLDENLDEHSEESEGKCENSIYLRSGGDVVCLSSDEDSYSDNYVPLYERLRNM